MSRVEYAVLCEGFDRLADDAKSAGVRIAFENTPFTHHVKTTQDAAAFVIEVGNPNGVLLLDIWHAYRGGTPYATLPALVPPEVVFGVELDDGLAEVVGTDLEDTFDNRLPCGEGIFDVPEFINAVLAIGWDGPWGIEQMSGDFRRLPVRDALTRPETRHCTASIWQPTSRRGYHPRLRYPGHAMLCGVTTRTADIDGATRLIPPWL